MQQAGAAEAAQEWSGSQYGGCAAAVRFAHSAKKFLPLLIELSGSSSQHEDVQSIHAGWDASIVQEIIDNYIMCQV